jgi:hypothetical protein
VLRFIHRERTRVKSRSTAIVVTLAVVLCAAAPAFAADEPNTKVSQYNLGDQTLSINAGLMLPLFLLPSGTWLLGTTDATGSSPHLTPGVVGSLCWMAYVTPDIRVGAELCGDAMWSPNKNTLLMLPLLAKASYIFTFYPFELPLSFAVGMNVVKYTNLYNIDLLIRPGASLYWTYDASWSFGLNVNYWLDMQFDTSTPANSRIGNFLEISLSALYHY